MSAVHDFADSLAASHRASDLPIWEEIYRKSFPDFLAMVDHRQDGEHQRAGIDRSVILENSKQILIDEKIRWKPYPDIAVEYLSNDRTGAPGWACKPLRADYIAYARRQRGFHPLRLGRRALAPAGPCGALSPRRRPAQESRQLQVLSRSPQGRVSQTRSILRKTRSVLEPPVSFRFVRSKFRR